MDVNNKNDMRREMENDPVGRFLLDLEEGAKTPEARKGFASFLQVLARSLVNEMPEGHAKDVRRLFCDADDLVTSLRQLMKQIATIPDEAFLPEQVEAIKGAITYCAVCLAANTPKAEEE